MYQTFQNTDSLDINMECKFSKIFERWVPENITKVEPFSTKQVNSIKSTLVV